MTQDVASNGNLNNCKSYGVVYIWGGYAPTNALYGYGACINIPLGYGYGAQISFQRTLSVPSPSIRLWYNNEWGSWMKFTLTAVQ